MEKLFELIKSQPVAFQSIIQSLLACSMGFGLPMTPEQMALVLTLTGTVLAFITHAQVTTNKVVEQRVEAALMMPVPEKDAVKDVMDQLKEK